MEGWALGHVEGACMLGAAASFALCGPSNPAARTPTAPLLVAPRLAAFTALRLRSALGASRVLALSALGASSTALPFVAVLGLTAARGFAMARWHAPCAPFRAEGLPGVTWRLLEAKLWGAMAFVAPLISAGRQMREWAF